LLPTPTLSALPHRATLLGWRIRDVHVVAFKRVTVLALVLLLEARAAPPLTNFSIAHVVGRGAEIEVPWVHTRWHIAVMKNPLPR